MARAESGNLRRDTAVQGTMRHLALALALVASCADARSSPGDCPGGDCFGMHQVKPPSACDKCGKKDLPTVHHYCDGCAAKLKRCAHCGRKRKAATPESPF